MEYFGTNLKSAGHYRWNISENLNDKCLGFSDLPFHPEELTNKLPKGEVIYYQGGGYTVLGISGSCADSRRETKSIFWVKELISKRAIINEIMKNPIALQIIKAIPFKINWNI